MSVESSQPEQNRPPEPTHRDQPTVRLEPPEGFGPKQDPGPVVGERRRPNNGGALGFTYTIYRFYDADDRLLYLGESGRIRQRIVDIEVGHPRGLPLGHDDGPKPWWREAVRIELQHLPPGTTEDEARAEERRQIELERPLYNGGSKRDGFDHERLEQVIDVSHFEADVATREHERHDGQVRDLAAIEVDSRRSAEQLRPGGASRLDSLARQVPANRPRNGESTHLDHARPIVAADDLTIVPDTDPGPTTASGRRPKTRISQDDNGPGSLVGRVLVMLVLAAIAVVALVMSLQAAF